MCHTTPHLRLRLSTRSSTLSRTAGHSVSQFFSSAILARAFLADLGRKGNDGAARGPREHSTSVYCHPLFYKSALLIVWLQCEKRERFIKSERGTQTTNGISQFIHSTEAKRAEELRKSSSLTVVSVCAILPPPNRPPAQSKHKQRDRRRMSAPPAGSSSSAATAAAIAASLASNGGAKRRFADPEYIAISEFLSSVGEVDDHDPNNSNAGGNANVHSSSRGANDETQLNRAGAGAQQKRPRLATPGGAALQPNRAGAAALQAPNGSRDLTPARRSRANGVNGKDMASSLSSESRARNSAGGASFSAKRENELALQRLDADFGASGVPDEDDFDDNQSDKSDKSSSNGRHAASRHTKLTDLEARVRSLERDNLHLKQTLLLGKNGSVIIAGRGSRENIQRLLSERTKVVTEMVEQLNASFLTIGDASRVWHQDCRIGVGVREWDAFGQLQTISLWNMIRSVFATIAVDIVELRPHLPDGEMILTKWRIQGEIASQSQLESVCSSEDCPPTMKVALMAIKSSDLTFTVTTYVIFQDAHIAEQHHCWDQVGVFKRLFGGEIPPSVQDILTIK